MLTGNEKAWSAFIIGTVVQSLDIVISFLPVDADLQTVRITLLVIVGVVGTIGQGLGVYQISNTPAPVPVPLGTRVGLAADVIDADPVSDSGAVGSAEWIVKPSALAADHGGAGQR